MGKVKFSGAKGQPLPKFGQSDGNVGEFSKAFNCPVGSKYNPEEKCGFFLNQCIKRGHSYITYLLDFSNNKLSHRKVQFIFKQDIFCPKIFSFVHFFNTNL